MTAHVVVETKACDEQRSQQWNGTAPCQHAMEKPLRLDRCRGCLGDGTRAQLEQALPVEPIGYQWQSGDVLDHAGEHPDRPRVWRELRP